MNFPEAKRILDNLVPISEAPAHMNIAEKTLRNWRSQGIYSQIFVKIGGRVFINLAEYALIVQKEIDKAKTQAKRYDLD